METPNADTFRNLTCAIDPYVRGREAAVSEDEVDLDIVLDSIQAATRIVMEGSSLEKFCRETDVSLLFVVQIFCRDQWIQHRYKERGLA